MGSGAMPGKPGRLVKRRAGFDRVQNPASTTSLPSSIREVKAGFPSSGPSSRAVSGETLVDIEHSSPDPQISALLQKGVEALNEDWTLDSMPGDNLTRDNQLNRAPAQKSVIQNVATATASAIKSVLGKRSRENQATRTEKRRKSTTSNAITKQIQAKAGAKPREKRWLSSGLYTGQEGYFDTRLVKNRPVKINRSMPLPIFHGERVLAKGRDFELPWSIYSPLPTRQTRPEDWKQTNRSDAAASWRESRRPEQSRCMCSEELGCDDDCLNRTMLYECDEMNCNLGPKYCTNRAFRDLDQRRKRGRLYDLGVEIVKTEDRGHGVRACRSFQPHQIIVEYTGEIITQEESDRRMHTIYKGAKSYYLMDFDQNMILDATRGSMARFVNHSCAPNCEMVKWTVAGKPRMALFAGKDGVVTGDELTYDYNFSPYSTENTQTCCCGAKNCRGVLGPRPKDIKEVLDPMAGLGKRKIQQFLEDTVDNVVETFGSNRRRIKDRLQEKNKKLKALPKGWIYQDEVQPLVRRRDPEIIMRSHVRKSIRLQPILEGGSDEADAASSRHGRDSRNSSRVTSEATLTECTLDAPSRRRTSAGRKSDTVRPHT